jgi:hypothetical protein
MASKPAVSHRSPVRNPSRPEPRLPSALLHADDRVMSWLGRMYGGDAAAAAEREAQREAELEAEQRSLHGLDVPFEHDSAHLNPHDVLVAFIHAARAGQERNFEALEAGAPRYLAG